MHQTAALVRPMRLRQFTKQAEQTQHQSSSIDQLHSSANAMKPQRQRTVATHPAHRTPEGSIRPVPQRKTRIAAVSPPIDHLQGLERTSSPSLQNKASLQQQQHKVLESVAQYSNACISSETPSGCRGLVATRDINSGDVVLSLSATCALSVPRHHALRDVQSQVLADWRVWLQQQQAVHGRLPEALVEFLADVTIKADVRIATWLLYLKQQHLNPNTTPSTTTTSSSSSSTFWQCFLKLLPQMQEYSALDSGLWSDDELSLLEPQIMKVLLTCYNNEGLSAVDEAHQLLTSEQHEISQLQLASSRCDIFWSLSAAKTRPYHDKQQHCTSLYPLLDQFNHQAYGAANCKRDETAQGYVVRALRNITQGEELTVSYPDNNMPSNIDLMANWGFVLSPNPGDMLLSVPRYFGTLSHISWLSAVQAAAAVVNARQQKQGGGGGADCSSSSSSRDAEVADLQVRLAAAAASLPLQLPNSKQALSSSSSTGSSSSSSDDGADADSLSRLLSYSDSDWNQGYLAAVKALKDYLITAAAAAAAAATEQQQQQAPDQVYQALYHLEECGNDIQTQFRYDLSSVLRQQQGQQQQHKKAGQTDTEQTQQQQQQQQQQLQGWTAQVVRNSCLALLASCSTTAAQDELLLPTIYQQQQQQQQSASAAVDIHKLQQQQQQQSMFAEFERVQLLLVYLLAIQQAYTVLQSASSNYHEEAVAVMDIINEIDIGSSTSSSSSSSSGSSITKVCTTAPPQQQQQQGIEQQQGGIANVGAHLAAHLPQWHIELWSSTRSPDSSNSGSSSSGGGSGGGSSMRQTKPWKDAEMMRSAADQMFSHLSNHIPQLLAQQSKLISKMEQLQQKCQTDSVQHIHWLLAAAAAAATWGGSSGNDQQAAGRQEQSVSSDRIAAAVSARLEQKRMLAVAAELCAAVATNVGDER